LTTSLHASLTIYGVLTRGMMDMAPQAPPYWGGEALAVRPEFFTQGLNAVLHKELS